MDEKTIPFYKRREFKYLAIACIALIVTAVGANFYNKHPRPVKQKRNRVVKEEPVPSGPKATVIRADSISYQAEDSLRMAPDTTLR
ncbi:hypothetical protein [Pedobacter heparinus]|uniref:hypothetical protein n=1 Tax=Pedobacter heparinus TaxID=984 RepID=UPI00292E2710|nr:hypothetical protein [Pedobacter heparinus]